MAALLEYPTDGTLALLKAFRAQVRHSLPRAAEWLGGLEAYLVANPVESVQELYTSTFDLTPVCTLDIGYHLFGEDYQRGRFLALLRESQEKTGMKEERELPDHLPVLLRWLARVRESEVYSEMLEECVLPALSKIDGCLVDSANPYRGLLQAVAVILKQDLKSGVSTEKSEGGVGCHSGASPLEGLNLAEG